MGRRRKKDIQLEQNTQSFNEIDETDKELCDEINSQFDEQDENEGSSSDMFEDDIYDEYNDKESFEQQMTKKRRSKQYYVKGKDLVAQIKKYQESLKNDPEGKGYISEQLGAMILKICTRFSLHPKFFGYTYRDEMVADAVTRCLTKSIAKINLDLPSCNPFAYFTQTALNCFRARINAEKKFMMTKQRYRELVYDEYENEEGIQHTKDNDED